MSRPHGEPEFTYHPHRVDNLEFYRQEYDRIFRKSKQVSTRCEQPVRAEDEEKSSEEVEP